MKEYAKEFYLSVAWQRARDAHLHKTGYLCERCLKQGIIEPAAVVHHKIHITPENISDTKITLDDRNLESLCVQCHADVHSYQHRKPKRWRVDEDGSVTGRDMC